MTRCKDFYEKVERDGDFCGMNEDTLREVLTFINFIEENPDLSGISEKAAKPLIREKDLEVKAKAIEAIGKNISHGNVPTAKQVRTILENKRVGVKPKGHISNDLSGIYRPPIQPTISEVLQEEAVVIEEEVVVEEEVVDEEEEVVDEEEEVVTEEENLVMPGAQEDDFESIPQMPEMVPQGPTPVVEEEDNEKDNDIEVEEKTKKTQEEVDADERERIERLKELEEQRADKEAEKIVATCLKSILKRGYPGHKLSWLVNRAVTDVLIPDRGCPMPDSGSATRGGAITSNLGAR